MSVTHPVLAFQAVPEITKEVFVAGMLEHRRLDHIARGAGYWDGSRGCAIGCNVQTINALLGEEHNSGDHRAVSAAIGIPVWMARAQDRIFEGLPVAEAIEWPVRFAQAIPAGADLSGVLRPWLASVLREVVLPVSGQSKDAVESAIAALAKGQKMTPADAEGTRRAAQAARRKAAEAEAAAAAAAAWAAAWAAAAAEAEAEAEAEGRERAYSKMADLLLSALAATASGGHDSRADGAT